MDSSSFFLKMFVIHSSPLCGSSVPTRSNFSCYKNLEMRFVLPLLVLTLLAPILRANASTMATVIVPVADVRSDPSLASKDQSDAKEETQVLFGEVVEVLETRDGWSRVSVPSQQEFTHHEVWEGYPGWIASVNLSTQTVEATGIIQSRWVSVAQRPKGPSLFRLPLGSRVRVIQTAGSWAAIDLRDGASGWIPFLSIGPLLPRPRIERQRAAVLDTARKFVGYPYVWGGRSPYDNEGRTLLSGVDCSGLVHLALSANGIVFPRDAHEQWMRATPIKRDQLQPGDLVFSGSAKMPTKVTHVAFYRGQGFLLEAPQTGLTVREISFKRKFGKDLRRVESGDAVGERVVYFGRWVGL